MLPLRGATSDLCLGSGLTANRTNLFNASGLYLPLTCVHVRLNQHLAIRPLLTLPVPDLATRKVISLEPRTPRQPGKLRNVSKNDYVFTLSMIFRVNENPCDLYLVAFNRVQPVHKPVTGFGADRFISLHSAAKSVGICWRVRG